MKKREAINRTTKKSEIESKNEKLSTTERHSLEFYEQTGRKGFIKNKTKMEKLTKDFKSNKEK